MRRCYQCQQIKSIEQFSWKSKPKGIKSANCKECHKKNRREHYLKNKELVAKQVKIQKKEYKKWFLELKEKLSCENCGEKEPACLDFHHLSDNKDAAVSEAISKGWRKEKVLKEIEKCAVLCANCHRKVHAGLVKLESCESSKLKSSEHNREPAPN